MTQGLLKAVIAQLTPPELRGLAYSLFFVVSGVAILLGNSIAGVLSQYFGLYATFLAGASFTVVSAVMLQFTVVGKIGSTAGSESTYMIDVTEFFDDETATLSYVVSDRESKEAAVIDSLLNYDQASGLVATTSADSIIAYLTAQQLTVRWLLETHIHADHLSGSLYLKQQCGGQMAIGSSIKKVLEHWIPFFNIAHDTSVTASQFDVLLDDGDIIKLGATNIRVVHTPGHTPACVSYVIADSVFVGDALFLPDVGTGRADFPGANAAELYDSTQKILSLPPSTFVYSGHDYPPPERSRTGKSTVREQLNNNILLKNGTTKEDFVTTRTARDIGKAVPKLLYPSIQVNIRGGSFGASESNGTHFIKIPTVMPSLCLTGE